MLNIGRTKEKNERKKKKSLPTTHHTESNHSNTVINETPSNDGLVILFIVGKYK